MADNKKTTTSGSHSSAGAARSNQTKGGTQTKRPASGGGTGASGRTPAAGKQAAKDSRKETAKGSAKESKRVSAEERAARAKQREEDIRFLMEQQKRRKELSDDITIILVAIGCILLYLGYFGLGGRFGSFINAICFGLLGGFLPYLFPIALFVMICYLKANRDRVSPGLKIGIFLCATWVTAALVHLVTFIASKDAAPISILRAFSAGYKERSGGGVLGAILCNFFCTIFGKVATLLLLVALLIICFILITEISLITLFRKKTKQQRLERMRKREELAAYRKEYEEQAAQQQTTQEEPWRHEMSQNLDELQEDNRSRKLKLVEVETPEHPDLSFYDKKEPKKKEKKKTFLDVLMETGARSKEEELPKPDVNAPDQQAVPVVMPQSEEMPTDSMLHASVDELDQIVERKRAEEYERDLIAETPVEKPLMAENASVAITAGGVTRGEDLAAGSHFAGGQRDLAGATAGDTSVDMTKEAEKLLAEAGEQPEAKPAPEKPYVYPPLRLLSVPQGPSRTVSNAELKETALKLQNTLRSFGVAVTVTNISCGPSVTRFELQPDQGVKVSRITALADDIKLNLAAADIRIEAPIPGKAAVGIEVPNSENTTVNLRSLFESSEYREDKAKIAFAVGKDIGGKIIVTDIAKMPHLLIAGATGSGKSVCINTLIMSILFKYSPKEVRLIMVDPKVVELSVYNGIPHLFAPVVTDAKIASNTLNWAVVEMTKRYQLFAELGVRDMAGFNAKVRESLDDIYDSNGNALVELPHIVIIVDELADLMMVASGDVEDAICRLAQLARAAGIHLVIATQRPSVNVITGIIKANIPSRIAFAVSSAIDSRTIIDQGGAEKLLGKGDMLFAPSWLPKPARVQGAFVSDNEVSAVVSFLKQNNGAAVYNPEITAHSTTSNPLPGTGEKSEDDGRDPYFAEAGRFIIDKEKASIGSLQRLLKIGFNRAARIMDQLAEAGVVGPEEGTKPRKILMSPEEFEQFLSSGK